MHFLAECRSFVSDLGFPIFVAVYLLIFSERTMRKFTAALQELIALQREHNIDEKLHHQANSRRPS